MKKFEDLEFTDGFMFSTVLYTNHEICKELLELILNIKISKLVEVETEKTIWTNYDAKGVRFDVYVKDEVEEVFDIEMQVDTIENLPKRSRYYLQMIDSDQLARGADYSELKDSYVIFICKDKLNVAKGKPIYYYQYIDKEDHEIRLNAGSNIIFVNSWYDGDKVSAEFKAFLRFIRTGELSGNKNNLVHQIDSNIIKIKNDRKWKGAYMTLEQVIKEESKKAYKDGLEQGIEQGVEKTLEYLTNLSNIERESILKLSSEEISKLLCGEMGK